MLLQTYGWCSQRVYWHLNVSLSLHNLLKHSLKKLNLIGVLFYAARSQTCLETLNKNEMVSGSKQSTEPALAALVKDEF